MSVHFQSHSIYINYIENVAVTYFLFSSSLVSSLVLLYLRLGRVIIAKPTVLFGGPTESFSSSSLGPIVIGPCAGLSAPTKNETIEREARGTVISGSSTEI